MKYNIDDPEKQDIVLNRIKKFDEKAILDLFHELKDEMTNSEILDNFVVQAMILVEQRVHRMNPNHKTPVADYYIRQYSNKDRLPVRLLLYRIIK